MATSKKKPDTAPGKTQGEGDPAHAELLRPLGLFGKRLHEILSRLPRSLRITRNDAIEMYKQVDEESRIRSLPYWLFIIASCGIATLGLILDSPAVVIGAMLISPLMAPITGLGMGIAINDIYLSFKSGANIVLSVLVAMLTAAIITLIVPYEHVTSEILSRTTPSLLDLSVALFCGLIAALSSVRSRGNDILKSVAPGAAIGVALMPPLCVMGYAVGVGLDLRMLWGSFLLFTTNLFAIVLVTSIFYYFVYNEFRASKLIGLLVTKRSNNELLYTSTLKPIWRSLSSPEAASRKRLWLPVVLIAIIVYPLATSLQAIKQRLDVQAYVRSSLSELEGMQIIRGPDSLQYSSDGATGSIIYASAQTPGSNFLNDMKEEVAERFDGYRLDIAMVRVAGDSDLSALRQQRELSLETSPLTLRDSVRHGYATDLVRRALDLIVPRFKDNGVVASVAVEFGLRGMERVRVFYFGTEKRGETKRALELLLRNDLVELQSDVSELKLEYLGAGKGRHECGARTDAAYVRAETRLQSLRQPIIGNPHVKIQLRTDARLARSVQDTFVEDALRAFQIIEVENPRCLIEYEYML